FYRRIVPNIPADHLAPIVPDRAGCYRFRRDHQSFRTRIQRFGNEKLIRFRTVSIGGVDETHAQLDCASQNFLRVLPIRRPTPDPSPVSRIAPNPSRLTNRSPPNKNLSSLLLVLAAATIFCNPPVKTPAAPADITPRN